MQAINWNTPETNANIFWDQNLTQFWTPEEFNVAKDLRAWNELNEVEKDVYVKVLAGLTGLDTLQANEGMPTLLMQTEDLKSKAVMSFMSMMEQIHAMSYSHIFTTLLSDKEIKKLLEEWVPKQEELTTKGNEVSHYYNVALGSNEGTKKINLYLGYAASVFLESFLFYSGFYYPLYLAGQGKMTTSGEIIRKIIMDESIHGGFIGLKAQEIYNTMNSVEKGIADDHLRIMWGSLLENEDEYIENMYAGLGIEADVQNFTRYNLNKALNNLGKDGEVETYPVSAIVMNGLDTNTKTHDFFSVKGDGYVVSSNVEDVSDDDFVF